MLLPAGSLSDLLLSVHMRLAFRSMIADTRFVLLLLKLHVHSLSECGLIL